MMKSLIKKISSVILVAALFFSMVGCDVYFETGEYTAEIVEALQLFKQRTAAEMSVSYNITGEENASGEYNARLFFDKQVTEIYDSGYSCFYVADDDYAYYYDGAVHRYKVKSETAAEFVHDIDIDAVIENIEGNSLKQIKKTSSGGKTQYTVEFLDIFDFMPGIKEQVSDYIPSAKIKLSFTLDTEGSLVGISGEASIPSAYGSFSVNAELAVTAYDENVLYALPEDYTDFYEVEELGTVFDGAEFYAGSFNFDTKPTAAFALGDTMYVSSGAKLFEIDLVSYDYKTVVFPENVTLKYVDEKTAVLTAGETVYLYSDGNINSVALLHAPVRITADGSFVLYTDKDGGLYRSNLSGTETVRLTTFDVAPDALFVGQEENTLYYSYTQLGISRLVSLNLVTMRSNFELKQARSGDCPAPFFDGEYINFTYNCYDESGSKIGESEMDAPDRYMGEVILGKKGEITSAHFPYRLFSAKKDALVELYYRDFPYIAPLYYSTVFADGSFYASSVMDGLSLLDSVSLKKTPLGLDKGAFVLVGGEGKVFYKTAAARINVYDTASQEKTTYNLAAPEDVPQNLWSANNAVCFDGKLYFNTCSATFQNACIYAMDIATGEVSIAFESAFAAPHYTANGYIYETTATRVQLRSLTDPSTVIRSVAKGAVKAVGEYVIIGDRLYDASLENFILSSSALSSGGLAAFSGHVVTTKGIFSIQKGEYITVFEKPATSAAYGDGTLAVLTAYEKLTFFDVSTLIV